MDRELSEAYEALIQAMSPEDVFGEVATAEDLETAFRRFARVCHPDRHHGADADTREVAAEAFRKLSDLRDRAEAKLAASGAASPRPRAADAAATMEVKTAKKTYRVVPRPFVEGDLALLYRGTCVEGEGDDAKVVLKLAREATDNDLVRNEARVIGRLRASPSAQTKHVPVVLDEFRSDGKQGLVLRELDGLDGLTLREKLTAGVPPEHGFWILRRLLSVLGYAHSLGILHGNVEPAHVMVRPKDHNVFLVDWCYGIVEPARTGEGFRTRNEDYGPPEVAEGKPPIPASDLFSAGRTMQFLLGGDPPGFTLPAAVPDRLKRILSFMTLESSRGRAQDAWSLYDEVGRARLEVYGPHRFQELRV